MTPPTPRVGTAAITENMLKRKWSAVILRYLDKGINDPAEITKREPNLSAKVLSERLRTMVRYNLVARFPRPAPIGVVEYRLTVFGRKILEMLNAIDQLDPWTIARPPPPPDDSSRRHPLSDETRSNPSNFNNPA